MAPTLAKRDEQVEAEIESIVSAIDRRGLRVTGPRRTVIAAMARFGRPFSASELTLAVARLNPAVGRASVYRTLALLARTGAVERLHGAGRERYTLCAQDSHHHHVTCTRCGRTGDFALSQMVGLEQAVDAAVAALGYRAQSHVLEVRGLCRSCRDERSAPAVWLQEAEGKAERR